MLFADRRSAICKLPTHRVIATTCLDANRPVFPLLYPSPPPCPLATRRAPSTWFSLRFSALSVPRLAFIFLISCGVEKLGSPRSHWSSATDEPLITTAPQISPYLGVYTGLVLRFLRGVFFYRVMLLRLPHRDVFPSGKNGGTIIRLPLGL